MSEFMNEQYRKFLVALKSHDKEIFINKKGVNKMLCQYYKCTDDGIAFEKDIPKEVLIIIRNLEKSYLVPPFKK